MDTPKIFRYQYTFLYQSMAVYATTLALYLVVRGMMQGTFAEVFYDPVVYLLCIIIIISALAVLYNVMMRRRIEIVDSKIVLKSALRSFELERSQIRNMRLGFEHGRMMMSGAKAFTIFTSVRRRPIRIRPNNFERSDELSNEIRAWAGDKLHTRSRRRRRLRKPRT